MEWDVGNPCGGIKRNRSMASMQLREMPENCSAAKGVRGGEGCRAKGPRVLGPLRCQRTRGVSARTGDGPPHGIAAFKNSSGLVRKKEVVTEHIPV